MIALTGLCLLSLSLSLTTVASERRPQLEGVHARLDCAECHGMDVKKTPRPSSAAARAEGCTGCHAGYDRIFDQAMTTRADEKQFAAHAFGEVDPALFDTSCSSCHVSDCLDCHGGDGHKIAPASQQECLACHKGYYVGREYLGMAPREDHSRYQRGQQFLGEPYLKMRPDVHSEFGMECMDCHSMQSLIAGKKAAKQCGDCHQADPQVIEHGIAAHLDSLECYACHSAWAAQEYGTFFLRIDGNEDAAKRFKVADKLDGSYLVRAYLRQQNVPPLGVNARGKISPIRPQFIAYYSDLRGPKEPKIENRLLTASWKAFFPHTVRTGTVMCNECHDNRRRFLLEKEEDRIYRIDLDEMGLSSFWNQAGQQVSNGSFVSPQRFSAITEKSAAYSKAYVAKWKSLLGRVEDSSKE
jgi:hypothetical protein